MTPIAPESMVAALQWRYAVKEFDLSRTLSASEWEALAQLIQLSPSSYGLQPWQCFVVPRGPMRKQLSAAAWNQPQVESCSHLLIFAARKSLDRAYIEHYIAQVAKQRSQEVSSLDGYRDLMVKSLLQGDHNLLHWSECQTYLALGNLLTSAAALGIDACPMEGFDPQAYDAILGLRESGYTSKVVAALGHRSNADRYQQMKKVRLEQSELFRFVDEKKVR